MQTKTLLALAMLLTLGGTQMWANEIALEGSDATAFHHDALYTTQLFTFLQNGSSLPVLVLGTTGLAGASGQYVLNGSYSLTGVNLANYSAVYIESIGGCCTQADHAISAVDEARIGAAEALGLNLAIENYGGGPAWGPILPAAVDLLPSSDFGGITDFGTAGGPTCTDGEVFNANGLSKGFLQPPVLSCYEHQGYLTSAFTALGFISLVNADPGYFGAGGLGSAFEALGGPLGMPTVPEPTSILLLASLAVGLGSLQRRRMASKA